VARQAKRTAAGQAAERASTSRGADTQTDHVGDGTNGHTVAAPPIPEARSGRGGKGGRPPDPETRKVYEFCYTEYVTNDKGASTVMLLCNRRFGEGTIREIHKCACTPDGCQKKRTAAKTAINPRKIGGTKGEQNLFVPFCSLRQQFGVYTIARVPPHRSAGHFVSARSPLRGLGDTP